ncbi:DUF4344 domain-containing metallopeptidase [Balneatrix alpica]|uniref:DUF4344 domain-containing metallopeptidase n=1 Tax=Balneatrix alpica TaxID=75684 RepID=A0ABV5ZAR6_9GAMM|nr:DUF4344 domain-containing metallopeptidase [Balneatrix alpica]
MLRTLFLGLGLTLSSLSQAAVFQFAWQPSQDPQLQQHLQQQWAPKLEQLLQGQLQLKQAIKVSMGAEEGPQYDPNSGLIEYPYQDWHDIQQLYQQGTDYSAQEIATYTQEIMTFTLLHELAHALVHQLEIPVLGKEEDAADTLAALLLLERDDTQALLSSMEIFDLWSQQKDSLEAADFMDEHSLDDQRFYALACLLVGYDPEGMAELAGELDMDDERVDFCIEEYGQKRTNWQRLLKGYWTPRHD